MLTLYLIMAKTISLVVTEEGLRLPAQVFSKLGEVEVVTQGDWIMVRPKSMASSASDIQTQALAAMRAAGLTIQPAWEAPPSVTEEERSRLAHKLGHGPTLSQQIIDDRSDR